MDGVGLALGLLVPASALAALAMHAYRAAEVPSRADWERAAAAVRAAYQPGDIVAFLPGWAQEGRGLFAGLEVVPSERWSEDDVARAGRVFVVASFGARPPAWLRDAGDVEADDEHGRLRVWCLRRKPARRAVRDFVAAVPEARVTLGFPDRMLECPRRGERHDCGEGRFPWRWVGRQLVVVGGRPRNCVWAHPTTEARLTIAYPAGPLGTVLAVAHGLSDPVAGRGAGVDLDVWVGGERAAAIAHSPEAGWRRTRVDTARWKGRSETVRFVVTSPSDGARHFCFAAEARE